MMVIWASFLGCLPLNSSAMVIDSSASATNRICGRVADTEKILVLLETETVRQKLARIGLREEEIKDCLHKLNDQQLHLLAMEADKIRVGGNGGAAIVILLFIVSFILAVLYFGDYAVKVEKKHQ